MLAFNLVPECLDRYVLTEQFKVLDLVRPFYFLQDADHFPIFTTSFKHISKVEAAQVAPP